MSYGNLCSSGSVINGSPCRLAFMLTAGPQPGTFAGNVKIDSNAINPVVTINYDGCVTASHQKPAC